MSFSRQPRLLFPLTLATLLACNGDPVADPSATETDSSTGTGAAASTTSSPDPTTGGPTSTGSTGDPTTTSDTTTGDPDPICGDGHKDDGEACDNGADNGDNKACTTECALNICGDGKIGPGEGCDDGNLLDGDDCSSQCAAPDCGDGLPGVNEACDDANVDNTDECTNACTAPVCGDGFIQPFNSETCDDGADNNEGAACTPECLEAVCGDGYTLAGVEQCDSGEGNGDDQACTLACALNICGDGKQGPGEGCDDGNLADGDDCSSKCSLPDCGDGLVGGGEPCDDGNADNTDACTNACTSPVCGDGFLQPSNDEACDDGADNADNKPCTLECLLNVCGDGKQGPDEQCDDGNLLDSDGCSALCLAPPEATTLALKFSQVKRFDFSWAAATGATFYQLWESATDGAPYQQLGGDVMGTSLSLTMPLHLRFGARYVLKACNTGGCTDSAALQVVSTMAKAVGYFKASNTGANDIFGFLALSGDGKTLAVASLGEDSAATGIDGDQADNTASSAGAVYVFIEVGGVWSQQAYVKAPNTGAGDSFGISVALSADGSTLAVGASGEDSVATGINGDQANNTSVGAGAVYVLKRVNQTWSHQAYVKASNTGAGDAFGGRVSLSNDGDTLTVGAWTEDSIATGINGDQADNTAPDAGAVYVFQRTGELWAQKAYLKASNAGTLDRFGGDVKLSGDGKTLAVSARQEDGAATGIDGDQANNNAADAGATYVFRSVNQAWSQEAYIKASNTDAGDSFGAFLALSADSNTLVVGAPFEDSKAKGINGDQTDNSLGDAGAAYVYTRVNTTWSQQAYLKGPNTSSSQEFGEGIAISADGHTLVITAIGESSGAIGIGGNQADNTSSFAGAVYMFERANSVWSLRAYVKASNTNMQDFYGYGTVQLSANGQVLAVGAYQEDSIATGIGGNQADNSASSAGAVYVY